eukprot:gnl/TRDRNA2_/TRDRNA2_180578_c0_seq1.p1 gnl/TRDRNA2_/TRDRNA2_180578_c0~~gnl/TRDRNA2_/TRDRNA2_180578_c0_seq1.p1  ORF type:complete len:116 (-),score=27.54 gnl/TRDRNA2_/TRDRNA2_180578_c0_seq1:65-412(-)
MKIVALVALHIAASAPPSAWADADDCTADSCVLSLIQTRAEYRKIDRSDENKTTMADSDTHVDTPSAGDDSSRELLMQVHAEAEAAIKAKAFSALQQSRFLKEVYEQALLETGAG